MTTLAEDLVLLLIDPDSGRPIVDGTSLDRAIAGALLLDLTFAGRIDATGSGGRAKLSVTDPSTTRDPLLDEALVRLANGPVRAVRAVEKLSRRVRVPLLERLCDRGVLVRERGRLFGLIPTTMWRTADPRPRAKLQAGIADVLAAGREPDQRQAGLIALLHAVKVEHKIVVGSPRRELRARAKQIAEGDVAGEAVRKAIQAVQATVMTAVAAGAVAGSGS